MSIENSPDKIIVHHSADVQVESQLKKINEYHQSRGFTASGLGFYVGYHYLIAHSGACTQTRLLTDEGCHTIGENLSSIGICLEGNFDEEMPTEAQVQTLGDLLVKLHEEFKIPSTEIFPHRFFANKDCYGTRLSNDWARFVFIDALSRHLTDPKSCLN